jgi:hypothetical protein
MRTAAEMFSFDPNPTRAKNAWSSSTCLLYGWNICTVHKCPFVTVGDRATVSTPWYNSVYINKPTIYEKSVLTFRSLHICTRVAIRVCMLKSLKVLGVFMSRSLMYSMYSKVYEMWPRC